MHVHIPKAGGTAVEQLFHDLGDFDWSADQFYGHRLADPLQPGQSGTVFELQHVSARELDSLSGHRFRDFAWFAIVRDPYQRLISDFLWRQRVAATYPDAPEPVFEHFETFIDALPDFANCSFYRQIVTADLSHANLLIHTRPQRQFVSDASDELDERIHIVRFEDLPGSIDPLLARCGIEQRPFRVPSKHDLADFFDQRTLGIVNERYACDFESFGYDMVDRLPA